MHQVEITCLNKLLQQKYDEPVSPLALYAMSYQKKLGSALSTTAAPNDWADSWINKREGPSAGLDLDGTLTNHTSKLNEKFYQLVAFPNNVSARWRVTGSSYEGRHGWFRIYKHKNAMLS